VGVAFYACTTAFGALEPHSRRCVECQDVQLEPEIALCPTKT
jgi:hypothetical protein